MAVRHLGNPSIDAVAGKIVVFPQDAGSPNLIETYEMFHAFPQQEYVEEHGFGVTANLVVRAEAVRAVGGFDARLLSGGDREFCERLSERRLFPRLQGRCGCASPSSAVVSAVLPKAASRGKRCPGDRS